MTDTIDNTTDSRELDIRIAKALGYVIRIDTGMVFWDDGKDGDYGGVLPYYSTDLNAAASLPLDDSLHWVITILPGSRTSATLFRKAYAVGLATRDTEARARSMAWLQWMEAKESKGNTP